MLVDKVPVHLKSGRGGDGCESFEIRGPRKYYPMGGDGGKGGDVIIRADKSVSDLEFFFYNPRQKAENGHPGGNNKKTGRQGKDLILEVPVGTKIFSKEDNYLLRDLSADGEEFIALTGGWPGRGNHDNKTHSHGQPGKELEVLMDYTIPCDAAIVGMPNSGKSFLLSKLTKAKTKVTTYPFSTTLPQLGSMECSGYSRRLLCDLPSLFEGSSEGKGLGNRFLKHALRAKILLVVIDCFHEFSTSLFESYQTVLNELRKYSEELMDKEHVVLINKWDAAVRDSAEEDYARIKECCRYVYKISVETGENMDLLRQRIEELIPEGE